VDILKLLLKNYFLISFTKKILKNNFLVFLLKNIKKIFFNKSYDISMSEIKMNEESLASRKLELEREQFEFARAAQKYIISREYDLAYLKLTVVIVLLIIIIFYITCKFNASDSSKNSNIPKERYTTTNKVLFGDQFVPSPSILTNDMYRSDPQFDILADPLTDNIAMQL